MQRKLIAITISKNQEDRDGQIVNIENYIANQNNAELYGRVDLSYLFTSQTLAELLQTLKKDKGVYIIIDAQNIPERLIYELQDNIMRKSLQLIILNDRKHLHRQYLIIIPECDIQSIPIHENPVSNAIIVKSKLNTTKTIIDIMLMALKEGINEIIIISEYNPYWSHDPCLFKLHEIAEILNIRVDFRSALDDVE